jgi:MiaB-like tRNA modifying enzyme
MIWTLLKFTAGNIMVKVYIESYGCSASLADSEIIAGLLEQAEFDIVDVVENSDVNVLVTCSVKQPTSQRMIHRIKELTKTNRPLVVAGCMPRVEKEVIERINPKASLIGPDSIEKIVDVTRATIEGKKIVFLDHLRKPKLCLPRISKNPVTHITQISIGCDGICSYCSVKFAKGDLFCYPASMIVEDVRLAVEGVCKEIWLTSQDNAAYRFDNYRLPDLLEDICKIDGNFFVRVGMMNPTHTKRILDDLIQAYKNDKIFKFLHLPLQSASNRLLQLMNRGYAVEDFLYIVRRFREVFPKLTLATDIIVGFPGERESEFVQTVELIKEIKPDIVNISKFGPRPKTEAAKMEQLKSTVISERSKILHEVVKNVQSEVNSEWVDWEGTILVDEKGKNNSWVGRNYCYKPIVVKSSENLLGRFIDVRVTDAKSNYLVGEML